ncbi:MAG: NAD(P) transhydrogenase alpha subunit (EC, partial [uncultured Thiotrichaceae bacterium]
MSTTTEAVESKPETQQSSHRVGALRERYPGEFRVALTPDSSRHLSKMGYQCMIESGAGAAAGFSDDDYREAGVEIADSAESLLSDADIIIKVRPPSEDEVTAIPNGKTLISFFWPGQNKDLLDAANAKNISVLAMDMVPRISRAQKMDALSSMANIAGYRSVIEAGNHFGRFFTGQITAAGKVPPAKVMVIGAGVAGLAAIGTAQS